jgi:hypothetical protein
VAIDCRDLNAGETVNIAKKIAKASPATKKTLRMPAAKGWLEQNEQIP